MKNIFFVGDIKSSFVRNDYERLQKYFKVRLFKKLPVYRNIFYILRDLLWCDTVLGWFASYRMIFPIIFAKMLNKKIVVIAGGYDVVNAPEINYGAFARVPDKWVSKFVFKYADVILPVSNYIANELIDNYSKYAAPMKVIYNGVNIDKFYPRGEKVDNLVITVGEINWSNLKRKGLEDFVKAAKYLPNANFLVIGEGKDSSMDYLKSIATNNVMFLGFATTRDLLWWYQKAKVYAQLSYHEGFGLSVAEAMLCECIPVTSGKGALPEVTGKHGFFTPYGSPALAAITIRKALEKQNIGIAFRHRILMCFSLEKRIKELRKVLK